VLAHNTPRRLGLKIKYTHTSVPPQSNHRVPARGWRGWGQARVIARGVEHECVVYFIFSPATGVYCGQARVIARGVEHECLVYFLFPLSRPGVLSFQFGLESYEVYVYGSKI